MNAQYQYKLSCFVLQIRRTIESTFLGEKLIQVIQFLWILVILWKIPNTQVCVQNAQIANLRQMLIQNLTSQQNLQISSYLFIFCFLMFLINCISYMLYSHSINTLPIHYRIEQITVLISSLNIYMLELLIYPSLYSLMSDIDGSNFERTFAKGLITYLIYYFHVCSISQWSIFKQFVLIVAPCLWFSDSLLVILLTFGTCAFLFWKYRDKLKRIFTVPIFTALITKLWIQNFQASLDLTKINISLFATVINILSTILIAAFNLNHKKYSEFFTSIQMILQKLKKYQLAQKMSSNFKTEEIVEIYNFLLDEAKIIDEAYYEKLQVRLTPQLVSRSLYDTIQQMLKKKNEKSASIYTKILIIQIMIATSKPLPKIYSFILAEQVDITKFPFNFKIRYTETIKLLKKTYSMFNKRQNNHLQISQIQEANSTTCSFRQNCKKIMVKQIEFWEMFLQKKIKRQEMYQKFQQIMLLRAQIKRLKKSLLKINLYKKFNKMYRLIQRNFIQYEDYKNDEENLDDIQENIFKPYDIQSNSLQEDEKIISDKYLIIENSKIIKISNSFAVELKIKEKDFEDGQLYEMIGSETANYIMEKILYMNTKQQHDWFQLPFFTGKFRFLAFKARILWYPTLVGQSRYLIEIATIPDTSFLYYNVQANEIRFYSQHFAKEFQVNEGLLQAEIQSHQLKYEKLFATTYATSFSHSTCVLSTKYKQRQKSYVPLELKLENFLSHGSPKLQSQTRKKIFGRGYDYIYMADNMFTILQIKGFRFDSLRQIGQRSQTTILLHQNSNQQSLEQKYQNQRFYCLIPNSFETKITQKIASIKTSRNIKRWMCQLILGVTFVTFLMGFDCFKCIKHEKGHTEIKNIWSRIENGYEEMKLIYIMYDKALNVYRQTKYPQYNQSQSENLIQTYKADQQACLKRFLNIYLNDYKSPYSTQDVAYSISFDYFKVQVSTKTTSLMDFASNFKKNLDENEYDFIMNNYISFRNFSQQYQQSMDYIQRIEESIALAQVFFFIYFTIGIGLIILMSIAAAKNEYDVRKVIRLYTQIKDQQLLQKIYNLRKQLNTYFQCKILTSQSFSTVEKQIPSKQQEQPSLKYIVQGTANLRCPRRSMIQQFGQLRNRNSILMKQLSLQKHKNTHGLSNVHRFPQIEFNPRVKSQFAKNSPQMPVHHKISITVKMQPSQKSIGEKNKQIEKKEYIIPFLQSYMNFFIFLLLAIGIAGQTTVDFQHVNIQKGRLLAFFNFQKVIFSSIMDLNKLKVDTYFLSTFEHIYNEKIQLPQQENQLINVRFQLNTQFPDIAEIQNIFSQTVQSNLCLKTPKNEQFPNIECSTIAKGILTHGYSESFIFALQKSFQISNYPLKNISNISCGNKTCTNTFQFDFLSNKLQWIVNQAYKAFSQDFDHFNSQSITIKRFQIFFQTFINIFVMIGLILFARKEYLNSQRAIQLFKFFPKTITNTIRVTNFLRKTKMLDTLQNL